MHTLSSQSSLTISRHRTSALKLNIEKDILRGVGLEKVLARFGFAFKAGVNDSRVEETDVLKSCEVDSLDDFISHNWGSGRIQKTLALCMIFNGKAAMIISAIVGMCVYALQKASGLPFTLHPIGDAIWAEISCGFVFVVVLLFWQDMRSACRMRTRKVFLDKYCINQTDPDKKAKGILGLGGFLNATQRVVICWTPAYFTRLWCVYEIATWLYLDRDVANILMMPLATSSSLLASVAMVHVMALIYHFLYWSSSTVGLVCAACMAANAPILAHTLRHLDHDLEQLPQQLRDFSVTKAACFCCTVQHKMPGTGEPLPCDRELVYKTLQRWFPTEDGSGDTWQSKLSMFDEEIKSLFGSFILQRAGPSTFHYQYAVMVGQPFLWALFDRAVHFGIGHKDAIWSFNSALEYIVVCFCVTPSDMKLLTYTVTLFNQYVGISTKRYIDVLASIACGFILFVIMFVTWLSVNFFASTNNTLGLCVSCSVWIFIVTPLCYRESLPFPSKRTSSETHRTTRCPQNEDLSSERKSEDYIDPSGKSLLVSFVATE